MKRVCECVLCGCSRCIELSENRGYCFRLASTWIRSNGAIWHGKASKTQRTSLKGVIGGNFTKCPPNALGGQGSLFPELGIGNEPW